ncbi:Peptidase S28 family-containing protein [Strongyloides ratti]|uniref:Peptidase S28 family-containing protein n=1 Tax=Strongyloides ratti TaxID=34506 RepID=A0A090MWY7_STRRB|nr:Peptidase S28 family-containing protein [Strongyloides ratti]CEF64504.1 Peptidase S28 family-containing protein [Strongyloides ratti]
MTSKKFNNIIILLFSLSVFLVFSTPLDRKKFNRKNILINGRPWHGFKPILNLEKEDYPNKGIATKGFFINKIDHFDSKNTATYKQRYWYNKQWYRAGGPVFLMLGGEAAESPAWVERGDFEWTKLAQHHKAMVFLLEHRYYGNSRPTSDMSTENMKYLSSRQAIEDAASFIRGMNERFDYTNNTKWVVFGGSYSGALAAWARQLHPELIFAAVGSSGPVQAEVDFYQYLDVVKNSLLTYSSGCGNDLESGLQQLEKLVATTSGQEQIGSMFNLCKKWDQLSNEDIKYFWLTIIGTYMGVVQYSGDNVGDYRGFYSIKNLCKYHLDKSSNPLDHIKNVYNDYGGYSQSCLDPNYNEYIRYLRLTDWNSEISDDRAWTYQTCTEFGYYQSTDNDASTYWGNIIDSNWYVKQCTDIFGSSITNSTVYLSVAGTNSFYGGANGFKATNVILPNGIVDPWHALGVLTRTNNFNYPVIINGTAHCADMYPSSPDDLQSLSLARQTIATTLAKILS